MSEQMWLLLAAPVAVGILHTMVPDHWAPIALLARQHGWSRGRTARAAMIAGSGHTASTLVIALAVWAAGAALAVRFGYFIESASSVALIVFGAWIALGSWREAQHDHGHSHFAHAHVHHHAGGMKYRHWHEHHEADWHDVSGNLAPAAAHDHLHDTSSRTALLLILGSSPMVEGIPAFFAASRYGFGLVGAMAVLFAASTIATYVVLCLTSLRGMEQLNLGRFEQYGEVISGSFIALLGLVFLIWPML
jgi:ABC-type nickel/cobalt efflux system permease component RcnA